MTVIIMIKEIAIKILYTRENGGSDRKSFPRKNHIKNEGIATTNKVYKGLIQLFDFVFKIIWSFLLVFLFFKR
ncbi:MAG: hypothetical protein ACRC9F_02810 [Metamycoplasmataceae bacterium]